MGQGGGGKFRCHMGVDLHFRGHVPVLPDLVLYLLAPGALGDDRRVIGRAIAVWLLQRGDFAGEDRDPGDFLRHDSGRGAVWAVSGNQTSRSDIGCDKPRSPGIRQMANSMELGTQALPL